MKRKAFTLIGIALAAILMSGCEGSGTTPFDTLPETATAKKAPLNAIKVHNAFVAKGLPVVAEPTILVCQDADPDCLAWLDSGSIQIIEYKTSEGAGQTSSILVKKFKESGHAVKVYNEGRFILILIKGTDREWIVYRDTLFQLNPF